MARDYLSGDRDQHLLLPPDLREWLPAGHQVWFLIDMVARLDVSGFEPSTRDPRGRRGYDPRLLVTVLLYAYCVGERSSRRIERRCWEDVAFRVAAANLRPDHTTLSRFLKDHAEAFDGLFIQVLCLAQRMGMGRVGVVCLDGTKVAADASPLAAKTKDKIAEEVARITQEARETDAAEDEMFGDRRGDELPEDLVDTRSRRARLDQVIAEIEAQEAQDQARPPSKRPKKPRRGNVTDPQCRVVKGPRGFFPGYNAQAVGSQDGLIVAADVTQDQADNHQYTPMIGQAQANLEAAGMGQPAHALADNGYWSDSNVSSHLDDPDDLANEPDLPIPTSIRRRATARRRAAARRLSAARRRGAGRPRPAGDVKRRPKPIIPPARDKRRAKIPATGPVPDGATPSQILERTLAGEHAKALYKQRSSTIEPIFGQIKAARGITRFRRRGLNPARHEWRLTATTHNLLKMWRHTTRPALT